MTFCRIAIIISEEFFLLKALYINLVFSYVVSWFIKDVLAALVITNDERITFEPIFDVLKTKAAIRLSFNLNPILETRPKNPRG